MQKICDVYKSRSKEGMYLYVEKADALTRVPELLLERLGQTQHVMTMLIKPEQKIAQSTGEQLLKAIADNGFYLQLPPAEDAEMRAMADLNSKLSRG